MKRLHNNNDEQEKRKRIQEAKLATLKSVMENSLIEFNSDKNSWFETFISDNSDAASLKRMLLFPCPFLTLDARMEKIWRLSAITLEHQDLEEDDDDLIGGVVARSPALNALDHVDDKLFDQSFSTFIDSMMRIDEEQIDDERVLLLAMINISEQRYRLLEDLKYNNNNRLKNATIPQLSPEQTTRQIEELSHRYKTNLLLNTFHPQCMLITLEDARQKKRRLIQSSLWKFYMNTNKPQTLKNTVLSAKTLRFNVYQQVQEILAFIERTSSRMLSILIKSRAKVYQLFKLYLSMIAMLIYVTSWFTQLPERNAWFEIGDFDQLMNTILQHCLNPYLKETKFAYQLLLLPSELYERIDSVFTGVIEFDSAKKKGQSANFNYVQQLLDLDNGKFIMYTNMKSASYYDNGNDILQEDIEIQLSSSRIVGTTDSLVLLQEWTFPWTKLSSNWDEFYRNNNTVTDFQAFFSSQVTNTTQVYKSMLSSSASASPSMTTLAEEPILDFKSMRLKDMKNVVLSNNADMNGMQAMADYLAENPVRYQLDEIKWLKLIQDFGSYIQILLVKVQSLLPGTDHYGSWNELFESWKPFFTSEDWRKADLSQPLMNIRYFLTQMNLLYQLNPASRSFDIATVAKAFQFQSWAETLLCMIQFKLGFSISVPIERFTSFTHHSQIEQKSLATIFS